MQFPVNLAPTRHGKLQAFRRNRTHMLYYFCNEMLAKFMLEIPQTVPCLAKRYFDVFVDLI